MNPIYELLIQIVGEDNIRLQEPMKHHTTFRIGGNADYFVTPVNEEQIKDLIVNLRKQNVPYFVIGNGSNLLVSDHGYKGVIIQIYKKFEGITVQGNCIEVQAGALLSKLSNAALDHSLKGLEFASGIPGTVGGAVYMNAGAYNGEMKDVIVSATVLDSQGNIFTLSKEQLELGYRTSMVMEQSYTVISARFQLEEGNQEEIKQMIDYYTVQRKTKQPLEFPSAGSAFKRPVGYFAGKLITDANLKGYRIGGAQVSEKHAGFIINTGDATAKDVLDLLKHVQVTVKDQFGVTLETEVRLLGEE